MPRASEPHLLVLHALRLKGFAAGDAVVAQTGVDGQQVVTLLEQLQDDRMVVHRGGRVTGWALTPTGRRRHAELLAEELDGAGVREQVDLAYRRFLQANKVLLAVCTDWQMRDQDGPQVANDHSDPVYDKAVIERLGRVDQGIQPVCDDLSKLLARFTTYGPRLRRALEKVENGDVDWFTKPMIDSYHTVWFELHEDLLATLGIERSKEESAT